MTTVQKWISELDEQQRDIEAFKSSSARPWKWLPNEGQFIVDADDNIVAEIPCQGCNPIDGTLIVNAVNDREQLLARISELEGANKLLTEAAVKLVAWDNSHGDTVLISEACSAARQALRSTNPQPIAENVSTVDSVNDEAVCNELDALLEEVAERR